DLAVAERSYVVAQNAEAPDVDLGVGVEVGEGTDLAAPLAAPLDVRRHPAHVRVAQGPEITAQPLQLLVQGPVGLLERRASPVDVVTTPVCGARTIAGLGAGERAL